MVKITGYATRKTSDGKDFIALELTGGVELVQSLQTGKFYATVRKCSIPSTFNEEIAMELVGTSMKGCIKRIETEPYEFTNTSTGEVMTLNYSWAYSPEEEATVTNPKKRELVEAM